jgi:hypothetical protein
MARHPDAAACWPEVLTSADAARYLRLDDDHAEIADAVAALHRIVRTGHLRPVKGCGKSHKFALAELRRYVAAATTGIEERGIGKPSTNRNGATANGENQTRCHPTCHP